MVNFFSKDTTTKTAKTGNNQSNTAQSSTAKTPDHLKKIRNDIAASLLPNFNQAAFVGALTSLPSPLDDETIKILCLPLGDDLINKFYQQLLLLIDQAQYLSLISKIQLLKKFLEKQVKDSEIKPDFSREVDAIINSEECVQLDKNEIAKPNSLTENSLDYATSSYITNVKINSRANLPETTMEQVLDSLKLIDDLTDKLKDAEISPTPTPIPEKVAVFVGNVAAVSKSVAETANATKTSHDQALLDTMPNNPQAYANNFPAKIDQVDQLLIVNGNNDHHINLMMLKDSIETRFSHFKIREEQAAKPAPAKKTEAVMPAKQAQVESAAAKIEKPAAVFNIPLHDEKKVSAKSSNIFSSIRSIFSRKTKKSPTPKSKIAQSTIFKNKSHPELKTSTPSGGKLKTAVMQNIIPVNEVLNLVLNLDDKNNYGRLIAGFYEVEAAILLQVVNDLLDAIQEFKNNNFKSNLKPAFDKENSAYVNLSKLDETELLILADLSFKFMGLKQALNNTKSEPVTLKYDNKFLSDVVGKFILASSANKKDQKQNEYQQSAPLETVSLNV